MRVSSRTYVCFDCRTTERVPAARIYKACRKCRKPTHRVYYKFRIPGRIDDRGWAELEGRVRPMNLELQTQTLARLRQRRTRLERLLNADTFRSDAKRKVARRQFREVESEIKEWLQLSTG